MAETVGALLAGLLFFGLLIYLFTTQVKSIGELTLFFGLTFALFYGIRPLLMLAGLDTPFPDRLFPEGETTALLTRSLLALSLYLALAILGITLVTGAGAGGARVFFAQRRPDVSRLLLVAFVLTGFATVITALLLLRFGGPAQLIQAAKVDKALAGLFFLRVFPAVGAITAAATALEARLQAVRGVVWLGLLLSLLNAYFVFLWGSRSVFVVVGAILVLGLTPRGGGRQKVLLRIGLAAMLVIGVSVGLRAARDNAINGEVQEVFAESNGWRQATLGANATQFDAAMLAFRDWPESHDFRNGEDFVNGALGVIPRAVWASKPTGVAPGLWFRQVYEPEKLNGWPMGAAGVWYLNFGLAGLALGGLLAGLVVGLLTAAQRRAPPGGWNLAVAAVLGIYVFGLGWDSEAITRLVVWGLPVVAIGWFVAGPKGLSSPQDEHRKHGSVIGPSGPDTMA